MNLTPELVAEFKKVMTDPKSCGLDFPPLYEIFEDTEEATASHLLYEQYLQKIRTPAEQLPKIFFYIVMTELYVQRKSPDGDLGLCCRVIPDKTSHFENAI
jgi:hypothetical protein